MKLAIEPLAGGVAISPAAPPSDAIARAQLLDRVARAVVRRSPGADVVIGGRSLLALGSTPEALGDLQLGQHEPAAAARLHSIDVVYDGADLAHVAAASGMSAAAVAELHAARTYVALVTGFMPGFAYLGELDDALVRPRLAQPRARVPAGSLAIAGRFTGMYPFASPGGWHLLGRALDAQLFDPQRTPARRIALLDQVRFVACSGAAPSVAPAQVVAAPIDDRPASLQVVSSAGIATVQDEGRWGHRGEGVPWSGPLDADALRAANAAVGNPSGAACVEVIGGRLQLVCTQRAWISEAGAPGRWVVPGDRIAIDPAPRLVAYLAIRGGVDVPLVLGSRSTLLVAGLGGHLGRALRAGDRLVAGAASSGAADHDRHPAPAAEDDPALPATLIVTRAVADERLATSAFDELCRGAYRVSSTLDRVGVRLEGPPLTRVAGDVALPDPVLPGAIQVTSAGTPIVLGPDAGVTGGYPVVGWLDERSRSRLGGLRPGRAVMFRARG